MSHSQKILFYEYQLVNTEEIVEQDLIEEKNGDPFVNTPESKNILVFSTEKAISTDTFFFTKIKNFFPGYEISIHSFTSDALDLKDLITDFVSQYKTLIQEKQPLAVLSVGKMATGPFVKDVLTEGWYEALFWEITEKTYPGKEKGSFISFIHGTVPKSSEFKDQGKRLRFTTFTQEIIEKLESTNNA